MAAMESSPTPTYLGTVTDISAKIQKYFENKDLDFATYPSRFVEDIKRYCVVTQDDIFLVFALALLWTIIRWVLTRAVFLPAASHFRLSKLNASKFPESAWKTIFYGSTWAYTFYFLVYTGKYDYFYKPYDIWRDWRVGQHVPRDIYLIYAVQFSFYMHSVYGTLFMDRWRKDSLVMLFHHFLTMALIGFSFAARNHKIGLLVLFLHDIADVCLEFTKCNVYFKERAGKYYAIHDHISTVGFLSFASSWFIFRLYWFPLKVLYSTGVSVFPGDEPLVPFYFFFNVLLWVLQVLNIYWFTFIVNFLVKVVTGQMSEVDDIREEEVLEDQERKQRSRNQSGTDSDSNASNGAVPSKHKSRPKYD